MSDRHIGVAPNGSDPITITVTDPLTGEEATARIQPGEYALICHEPCRLEHTQVDSTTGTATITIKGYRRRGHV